METEPRLKVTPNIGETGAVKNDEIKLPFTAAIFSGSFVRFDLAKKIRFRSMKVKGSLTLAMGKCLWFSVKIKVCQSSLFSP